MLFPQACHIICRSVIKSKPPASPLCTPISLFLKDSSTDIAAPLLGMLLPQVVSETNSFILRGKQKAAGLLLKITGLAEGLLGVLVSQSLMMGFLAAAAAPVQLSSSCQLLCSSGIAVFLLTASMLSETCSW